MMQGVVLAVEYTCKTFEGSADQVAKLASETLGIGLMRKLKCLRCHDLHIYIEGILFLYD